MICPRCGKRPVLAMNCVLSENVENLLGTKEILMFCTRDHLAIRHEYPCADRHSSCGQPYVVDVQFSNIRVKEQEG